MWWYKPLKKASRLIILVGDLLSLVGNLGVLVGDLSLLVVWDSGLVGILLRLVGRLGFLAGDLLSLVGNLGLLGVGRDSCGGNEDLEKFHFQVFCLVGLV